MHKQVTRVTSVSASKSFISRKTASEDIDVLQKVHKVHRNSSINRNANKVFSDMCDRKRDQMNDEKETTVSHIFKP